MLILKLLGNLLGIGKGVLERKAKLKQLKQEQEHEIVKAQTTAITGRILGNSESDNSIDLITARNKKYTYKDEVVTYLFLMPVFIAAITPFIIAFDDSGSWSKLNEYTKESWQSLNELPNWYKYGLLAVVVDVLGFRSFVRKFMDKWSNKFNTKKQ